MVERQAIPPAVKREARVNPDDFLTLHEKNMRRSLALRQENVDRARIAYERSLYDGDEDEQRDAFDTWVYTSSQLKEAVEGIRKSRPENEYTPEEQAFLGRLPILSTMAISIMVEARPTAAKGASFSAASPHPRTLRAGSNMPLITRIAALMLTITGKSLARSPKT
jgi:hypothetical protein